LRKIGITPEDTAGSMRLVCPHKLKTLLPGKNIVMIAGQYDKIAPPEEVESLARQWDNAHFACFPQGHVGYTLMPESFRIAQELWAADFAGGPSFTTPVSDLKDEAMDAA
jgi:predicted esterase